MSISLGLLPLALAVNLTMRLVMGKDKFEAWINSLQIRFPTNFESETELVSTVKKAGYDAEKWGGCIKTHLGGKNDFFLWEIFEDKWVAVFTKYDPEEKISSFIKDLETKSGKKIFILGEEAKEQYISSKQIFPTDFRDGKILIQTLADQSLNFNYLNEKHITCYIGPVKLNFHQEGDAPFTLEVEGADDLNAIFRQFLLIDEDYKRYVQSFTYENLKEKISESNFQIESEEVLDDNSIVIRLVVS